MSPFPSQFIVDAFTDQLFAGNPAAVCLQPLPEALMQRVAQENNLSETAFLTKTGDGYALRWFTPAGEIDLCGHATLAAAHVVLTQLEPGRQQVTFHTCSGPLPVQKRGDRYEMDFPAYTPSPVPVTEAMAAAFGARPTAAYLGRDLLCVFDREETVQGLTPDQETLRGLEGLLQHATARGRAADCVSRSFAPKCGVPEDPVCGSGHGHIFPYWARVRGKDTLVAWQASPRGGTLYGTLEGDRVKLSGKAVIFAATTFFLPGASPMDLSQKP